MCLVSLLPLPSPSLYLQCSSSILIRYHTERGRVRCVIVCVVKEKNRFYHHPLSFSPSSPMAAPVAIQYDDLVASSPRCLDQIEEV